LTEDYDFDRDEEGQDEPSSGGGRDGSSDGDRRRSSGARGAPRARSRTTRDRRSSSRRSRWTNACSPRCPGYKGRRVTYKQIDQLEQFVTERGKIRPRRQTSACAKHQRMIAQAIKRARYMALLPFSSEHSFSSGDRR
jgi:small subunit ribosomal protein S18